MIGLVLAALLGLVVNGALLPMGVVAVVAWGLVSHLVGGRHAGSAVD